MVVEQTTDTSDPRVDAAYRDAALVWADLMLVPEGSTFETATRDQLQPVLEEEIVVGADGVSRLVPVDVNLGRLCFLTEGALPQFHASTAALSWRDGAGQWHARQLSGKAEEAAAVERHILDRTAGRYPPPAANDNIAPVPNRAVRATPFVLRDSALIPRREFLFGRHYARKFLSATLGAGGGGKSSHTVTETLAMATGRPLFDDGGLFDPLRVWYVNAEDPVLEIERRFAAAAKRFNIKPEHLGARLFADSGREQSFVVMTEDRQQTRVVEPVVQGIINELRDRKIDVLIVDPFVSTHHVSENDNSKIQRVAEQWVRIAELANCSVELVHHVRKTVGEITADDGRGAGALKDKARSVRVINAMTDDEAGKAGIDRDDRRDYFRIGADKANLARRGREAWRRFVSVPLGNHSGQLIKDGDEIGVVEAWQWPDAEAIVADVTPEQLAAIKDRISGGEFRQNDQAADWAGHVVAEALGLEADDKAVRKRIKRMISTWVQDGILATDERRNARREVKRYVIVPGPAAP